MARRPLHTFGMGGHTSVHGGMAIINMVAQVAAKPLGGGRGRRAGPPQEASDGEQRRQREETQIAEELKSEGEVGIYAPSLGFGTPASKAATPVVGRSRNEYITTEASLSVRGCSNWISKSDRGSKFSRGDTSRAGDLKASGKLNDTTRPSGVDVRSGRGRRAVAPEPRRDEREIPTGEEARRRAGTDAGARQSKMTLTIEDVVDRARSKEWVEGTVNRFVMKFHATSTWLSKQSKRRKMSQLLRVVGEDALTQLSALLDQTKHAVIGPVRGGAQVVARGVRISMDGRIGEKARLVQESLEKGQWAREESIGSETG